MSRNSTSTTALVGLGPVHLDVPAAILETIELWRFLHTLLGGTGDERHTPRLTPLRILQQFEVADRPTLFEIPAQHVLIYRKGQLSHEDLELSCLPDIGCLSAQRDDMLRSDLELLKQASTYCVVCPLHQVVSCPDGSLALFQRTPRPSHSAAARVLHTWWFDATPAPSLLPERCRAAPASEWSRRSSACGKRSTRQSLR